MEMGNGRHHDWSLLAHVFRVTREGHTKPGLTPIDQNGAPWRERREIRQVVVQVHALNK
jgi:hypothetical protein